MAVVNIKHKGLLELYKTEHTKKIGSQFHKPLLELMDILDAATALQDLSGVADFHPLKGKRKGEYSMHVNGPRVITFKFKDGDVFDVQFEDYH